jgi:HSP20 family protein
MYNPKNTKAMSLIRYNRLRPAVFGNLFDDLMNESFSGGAQMDFSPRVDVAETEKSYEIMVHLPGVKKDEVNIELENDMLTISGERKFENEKKEKNFHSVESYYGKFSRSFRLPETVNAEKIDARQVDGILTITLPKDEKKVGKKLIKIG